MSDHLFRFGYLKDYQSFIIQHRDEIRETTLFRKNDIPIATITSFPVSDVRALTDALTGIQIGNRLRKLLGNFCYTYVLTHHENTMYVAREYVKGVSLSSYMETCHIDDFRLCVIQCLLAMYLAHSDFGIVMRPSISKLRVLRLSRRETYPYPLYVNLWISDIIKILDFEHETTNDDLKGVHSLLSDLRRCAISHDRKDLLNEIQGFQTALEFETLQQFATWIQEGWGS